MANPTDIVNQTPALCETSTSEASVKLDHMTAYNLIHTGKNATVDDTNEIFFAKGTTAPAATYASSGNKGILKFGDPPCPIGPGWDAIAFKTASGTPRFQLIPIARYS